MNESSIHAVLFADARRSLLLMREEMWLDSVETAVISRGMAALEHPAEPLEPPASAW